MTKVGATARGKAREARRGGLAGRAGEGLAARADGEPKREKPAVARVLGFRAWRAVGFFSCSPTVAPKGTGWVGRPWSTLPMSVSGAGDRRRASTSMAPPDARKPDAEKVEDGARSGCGGGGGGETGSVEGEAAMAAASQ